MSSDHEQDPARRTARRTQARDRPLATPPDAPARPPPPVVRGTPPGRPQRPAPPPLDARPHHRRGLRPARRTGPRHPAQEPRRPPGDPHVPRRPAGPGVVEACASIAAGEQVRAMAFRLEQGPDLRWRCAAVELGSAPARHP
ncbi:Rv3235 family protein [Streptomyces laculatispora]|uniref:Rv3235 family protein n=1 Tax=Streptomyces laculatispora TaxID=887464 RepID=UPI003514FFF6